MEVNTAIGHVLQSSVLSLTLQATVPLWSHDIGAQQPGCHSNKGILSSYGVCVGLGYCIRKEQLHWLWDSYSRKGLHGYG